MLIRARTRPRRKHPHLIQRQPALPQILHTPRKLLDPARHRGNRFRVRRRHPRTPGHHRRERPRPGHPPQLITINLGGDIHNPAIKSVALTRQLRQLIKQHLKAVFRNHRLRVGGHRQRHNTIITTTTDKFGHCDYREQTNTHQSAYALKAKNPLGQSIHGADSPTRQSAQELEWHVRPSCTAQPPEGALGVDCRRPAVP